MKRNGSQIVAEVLLEQGVDTIFGYPGGAVLNLYDAFYEYRDRLRHVMSAHEQGAAHAADGYARSTGRVGVVIATSGPGATNLVTGIATAYMDSVPMVCITGNVSQELLGKDSFQEVYITGITMPITKHNMVVRDITKLADTLRDAFRIAKTGRQGPVLVDIPKDISAAVTEFTPAAPVSVAALPDPDVADCVKIAQMINESKRPMLYFGGGVVSSGAESMILELCRRACIPACHTIMGTGVLGFGEQCNLGLVGMHGCATTNYAVESCDLLLAIGVRFSDRVALNTSHFAPNAHIVHIDIDEAELSKNIHADIAMVCDVKQALERILPRVLAQERGDWMRQIAEWQAADYKPLDDENGIRPHQLLKELCEQAGEDAYYVTDVGQHQMWAAQYCMRTKARHFLTSGGLGTMGYGYGAAIGTQIAHPESHVIHITGDGSFHMNLNECCTAVSYDLPVITVVMNNTVLGMVYQWQHTFYGDRFSSTTPDRKTDFAALARAFGASGYRCETLDEFRQAFSRALASSGPTIIDCAIDKNERVLPMIPAGGTVKDMMFE